MLHLNTCFARQRFVNGEEFKQDGKFKTVSGNDVIVTKGSYTIVEKDGSITVVNYTADEHGFHPEVGKLSDEFTKANRFSDSNIAIPTFYLFQ